MSNWALDKVLHPYISKDGDCTACVGTLFQFLTTYFLLFFACNSLVSTCVPCLSLHCCQSPGAWKEEGSGFLHKSVPAALVWVGKGLWRDNYKTIGKRAWDARKVSSLQYSQSLSSLLDNHKPLFFPLDVSGLQHVCKVTASVKSVSVSFVLKEMTNTCKLTASYCWLQVHVTWFPSVT